ncbi:MAG: hypothetical protein ACKVOQ_01465 [Cyclobacteriaceae bacterium]
MTVRFPFNKLINVLRFGAIAWGAIFCFVTDGYSQDQKLRISGSINASGIGYGISGIAARRDPFYWLLSANLTLNYWKITAPFSFNLSQQDQTFRYPQPFNQFGISPNYKFVTLHLGYRSLNFSEFTLAGTIFLGAGVEVVPPNSLVKVSAMYGRLAKARLAGGLNDLELGIPSYERWGYGAKITLGKNGQEVDLIVFRGRDDPFSIPDSSANKLKIAPAENFVTGINVRRNLGNRLSINVEYALSAYTKDTRDPEAESTSYRYANYLGGLFTPTISSQFNGAFQGQMSYKANTYQLNFKYRRLGPDYKTMGSPFMNNDFEDITGGVATAFFKNKLNIATNVGVQQNNLNHNQETQVKRFIGSVTTSFMFNEKWNVSIAYNNFNSTTKLDRFYQQSQLDRIDTLLYLQVTNSVNGNVNYTVKKGDVTRGMIFGANYQVASDKQDNNSVFYNANVGYQTANSKKDVNFNANLNYNSNKVTQLTNSVGPTVTINKLFLQKKVKTSFSSSYIQFFQESNLLNENISARATCAYVTKSKHSFGVDLSLLNRNSKITTTPSFTEFRGGITYNYSFSKEVTRERNKASNNIDFKNKKRDTKGAASEVDELLELREKQRGRIATLKSKYDESATDLTIIGGKTVSDIDQKTFNLLLEELRKIGVVGASESFPKINEIVRYSNSIPKARTFASGTKLFKLVKKGDAPPTASTEYSWFTEDEFNTLKAKGVNFESKTSVPLKDMAEEYDIYVIEAQSNTKAFTSKIAPMQQGGYSTSGGAQQILIVDYTSWAKPERIGLHIPDSPSPDNELVR